MVAEEANVGCEYEVVGPGHEPGVEIDDVIPDVKPVRDLVPVDDVGGESGVARVGERAQKVALDRAQPAGCRPQRQMINQPANQSANRKSNDGR